MRSPVGAVERSEAAIFSGRLTLAFGARHIRPTILLQMLDDDPRHVLAGGGFNPFKPRRRVHFHHQRPVIGAQDIHPCHRQPHDLRRAQRRHAFFRCDLDLSLIHI